MQNKQSLRERKKQATRLAISDVATRLFIERGFDNVTVADIADAASVAKMTVFNYFPRKEDLFFDREDESRDLVRVALSERADGESPIDALRNLAHELVKQKHPFAKFTAGTSSFWQTVKLSPALSDRARAMRDELVNELAEMIAASVDRPVSDPEARLVAALFVTTWCVAYVEGLSRYRSGSTNNAVRSAFLNLIDRGFKGVAVSMKGTPYA
ncbi:MAG: TetR/AcrR family transcriptional regulator [Rhodanobacter sp.]